MDVARSRNAQAAALKHERTGQRDTRVVCDRDGIPFPDINGERSIGLLVPPGLRNVERFLEEEALAGSRRAL